MYLSHIEGVTVYEGMVYFNDWLLVNGHKRQEEIKDDLLSEGFSEEEINEQISELYDEFVDWSDENDLIATTI